MFRLPHWKVGKSVRRLNKFKLFTPLIFWRAGQRRSAAASCCTWVQTYRIRGPRAHTGAPRKGMRESNARPSESRPGAPTQSPRGPPSRLAGRLTCRLVCSHLPASARVLPRGWRYLNSSCRVGRCPGRRRTSLCPHGSRSWIPAWGVGERRAEEVTTANSVVRQLQQRLRPGGTKTSRQARLPPRSFPVHTTSGGRGRRGNCDWPRPVPASPPRPHLLRRARARWGGRGRPCALGAGWRQGRGARLVFSIPGSSSCPSSCSALFIKSQ